MRKKILLLGSSMTQRSFNVEHHGWGASLANWYCRTADVLNRGAGGYNSSWCRSYLSKLLGGEKPDIAILFIGNNDATDSSERQHVPLVEYQSNIISILESLYSVKNSMAVLLVTPTRVNEELKVNHCNRRRAEYADIVRDIVRHQDKIPCLASKHLALVDLWSGGDAVCADDLHDGAHLGRSGNKKVFDKLKHTINTHFPHLSPDSVKHRGNKRRQGCSAEGEDQLKTALSKRASSGLAAHPAGGICNELHHENISTCESMPSLREAGLEAPPAPLTQPPLQLTVPLWHEIDAAEAR